jgi:hypothetical protein
MVARALGVRVAAMAMNDDYQRRLQGWHSFARLMRWAVALIILVLIFLAYVTL